VGCLRIICADDDIIVRWSCGFHCACLGKRRHRGRHLLRVVVIRREERSFRPTFIPFLGLSLSWRELWSGCDVSGGCVHASLLTSYGRVPEGMLYSTMPL